MILGMAKTREFWLRGVIGEHYPNEPAMGALFG
jgi:hypothetical protein